MTFNPFYTDFCPLCRQILLSPAPQSEFDGIQYNCAKNHYNNNIGIGISMAQVITLNFCINYYTYPDETYIFKNTYPNFCINYYTHPDKTYVFNNAYPKTLIFKVQGFISLDWNNSSEQIEQKLKILSLFS